MEHSKVLACVLAALLSLSFSWPQSKENDPQGPVSSDKSGYAQAPLPVEPTGRELIARSVPPKKDRAADSAAPAARGEITTARISKEKAAQSSSPGEGSGSGTSPIEIIRIQNQLRQIMQANERFQKRHETHLQQIGRITDQARMHQQMLKQIERDRKSVDQLNASNIDEILRQEKLRKIQRDTQRNKFIIEKIS